MSALLVILIGTVLTNTFLLMQHDERLGGTRDSGSIADALRICGATFLTMMLAVTVTLLAWPVIAQARAANAPDVLLLLYSIGVVATAVVLHRLTRARMPRLRRALSSAPILIVGNCLALGVILFVPIANRLWWVAWTDSVALGAGFALMLPLFVALIARIAQPSVPASFRHAPIALVSAGLTALALMGFTGLLRG